ncbi:MAG: PKD domain-containing protein [Saprospiraceae bacterium]|nr:PKD domain-containing protein [Saprospiraceae bacterium]
MAILFLFSNSVFAQYTIDPGNNTSICPGSSITLGGNPTAVGGSNTYSWVSQPPGFTSNLANPIVSPTVTTKYILTVVHASNTYIDSVIITISSTPTANFNFSPDSVCSGTTISFTNQSTGGSNYLWDFGDGNTSTSQNTTHSFDTSGNSIISIPVKLKVTNSNGCSDSTTKIVHLKPKPDASIYDYTSTTPFTKCSQAGTGSLFTLVIDNTSTTSSTNTNYYIDWGDGTTVYNSTSLPLTGTSHTYTTKGFFNLLLIVTNSFGCVDSNTYQVFNGSNPAISLGNPGNTAACAPQTFTFPIGYTDSYNNPNSPGTKYTIIFNDGSPDTVFYHPNLPATPPDSITHTFTISSCGTTSLGSFANSFHVRIIASNPCGSSAATIEPINISSKPEADFSASSLAGCISTPFTFTDMSAAGKMINQSNYTCDLTTKRNWIITPSTGWTVTTGALGSNPPSFNPATWGSQILGVTFSVAGQYTIKLRVENNCGVDTISKTICALVPPLAAFAPSTPGGCGPLAVNTNNSSNTITSCDTTTYLWAVAATSSALNNPSWNYTGGTDSTSLNPSFLFDSAGVYTITLTIQNACGTSTASAPITVKSVPGVEIPPPSPICDGTPFNPIATFNNSYDTITGYNWTFTSGSPVTSNSQNPGQITYSGAGTYPFTASATNGCGTGSANGSINVVSNPTANFASQADSCENASPFALTGGTPVGGSYLGLGVSGGSFNPSLAGAGTHTLSYAYTDTNGCSDTATQSITVNPLPIMSLPPFPGSCEDVVTIALSGGSPSGGTYSGIGVSGGNFLPSTVGAGTYAITYRFTDVNGCSNDTTQDKLVNPLPNANAGTDTSVCNQPLPIQMIGTPIGGSWNGMGGITNAGVFTPTTNGTYTVYYSFTDTNSCSDSDTANIIVNNPVQAVAGNDTIVCLNSGSIQLTASPTGGNWTGPGVSSSGILTPSTAGQFYAKYNLGYGSCLTRDSILVNVNPLPLSSFTKSATDSCSPFTVSFTNNSSSQNGDPFSSLNFIWDFDNGITDTTANTQQEFTNTGLVDSVYNVSLITTTQYGCVDTTTQTVTIHPNPKSEFIPSTIIDCAPFTIDNSAINLQLHSGANTTYNWTIFDSTHTQISTFTGTNFQSYTMNQDGDTVYVRLITTNSSGCKADTSEVMFVTIVGSVANFSMDNVAGCHPLTVNFTNTSAPLSTSYYWNFGNGDTSSQISPSMVFTNTSNSVDSVYTISLISDINTGCGDTVSYTVTVYASPNADFSNTSACLGQQTVFQDSSQSGALSITNWYWNFGDGDTSTNQNTNHQYLNFGSYNVSHSVVNSNGCADTITKAVSVYSLPVVNYNHDTAVCKNDTVHFANSTTGAGTYNWSFGNSSSSSLQNPFAIYSQTGAYSIKLIASSGVGCIDSSSSSLIVREPPNANFSLTPDSGCAPLNVAFTNLSTGYNFTNFWNLGDGQTSTLSNPPTATYLQANNDTIYTPTLTATNVCGSTTHIDSVLVKPTPIAVFDVDKYSGCTPLTISFTNNLTVGEPDTFIWIFGDATPQYITTQTTYQQALTHTYTTTGNSITTYTITYIAINDCGRDTMQKQITVYPISVNAFFSANPTQGCAPLTVNFNNSSLGFINVYWDFDDGNFSNQINTTHTYINPGNYTVSLIVNDSCGYDTIQHSLTVWAQPLMNFTMAKDTICVNEINSFSNTSTSTLSSVLWKFGDGMTSTLNNTTHYYTAPGLYNVTLIGHTANNNCIDSISKTVLVLPKPNSSINATPEFGCASLQVQFIGDSSFHFWSFGDGNTSSLLNPIHSYNQGGTYIVRLISENMYGCSDTAYKTISVYKKPTANFNRSADSSCTVPVQILYLNQSISATSYLWLFGNGSTSTLNDSIIVSYTNSGIYYDTLIVSNQYNCNDTIVKPIIIHDSPHAQGDFTPKNGCQPLEVQFTNSTSNVTNYLWNFGDGLMTTNPNPSHIYQNPGTYPITLFVTANNGCTDSIMFPDSVLVYPKPQAGFTYNNLDYPLPNTGNVGFLNQSFLSNYFLWDFGDGFNDTTTNPVHQYMIYGNYLVSLYAENDFGCKDTAEDYIDLAQFKGLFVSNAFSPDNGPEEVRTFKPKGIGLKKYHLYIYDGWGNLIWETDELKNTEPAEGWDGRYNGVPLPQDVYVWKIEAVFLDGTPWLGKKYDNGLYKNYGTLTLLR